LLAPPVQDKKQDEREHDRAEGDGYPRYALAGKPHYGPRIMTERAIHRYFGIGGHGTAFNGMRVALAFTLPSRKT
jgi:hypothetical protein